MVGLMSMSLGKGKDNELWRMFGFFFLKNLINDCFGDHTRSVLKPKALFFFFDAKHFNIKKKMKRKQRAKACQFITEQNYDRCESCEEKESHALQHPLLKISQPVCERNLALLHFPGLKDGKTEDNYHQQQQPQLPSPFDIKKKEHEKTSDGEGERNKEEGVAQQKKDKDANEKRNSNISSKSTKKEKKKENKDKDKEKDKEKNKDKKKEKENKKDNKENKKENKEKENKEKENKNKNKDKEKEKKDKNKHKEFKKMESCSHKHGKEQEMQTDTNVYTDMDMNGQAKDKHKKCKKMVELAPHAMCTCGCTMMQISPMRAYGTMLITCNKCEGDCSAEPFIFHCPLRQSVSHPSQHGFCLQCAKHSHGNNKNDENKESSESEQLSSSSSSSPRSQDSASAVERKEPVQGIANENDPMQQYRLYQLQYDDFVQCISEMGFHDKNQIMCLLVNNKGKAQEIFSILSSFFFFFILLVLFFLQILKIKVSVLKLAFHIFENFFKIWNLVFSKPNFKIFSFSLFCQKNSHFH
ncbi:hypothetical protein RFI_06197 [Reticulomyxa filosa]|uniref:Uncharacterized protein n=1 Tax=Reticulomyxa filosa TaxID=46433 RepID=X6P078_RETFI|nr:hypothetical protein RFI_06197 [Reticulomyxa filosa]|eukprot:ETO30922.1 hypothetical protein RFI_06197 [Reticulomyxa filosa]